LKLLQVEQLIILGLKTFTILEVGKREGFKTSAKLSFVSAKQG